jgi:hypothetical protein
MNKIDLSPAQQQRLKVFKARIIPLKAELAALEQGVHSMLSTVCEMSGAGNDVNYSLNEECTALVATVKAAELAVPERAPAAKKGK